MNGDIFWDHFVSVPNIRHELMRFIPSDLYTITKRTCSAKLVFLESGKYVIQPCRKLIAKRISVFKSSYCVATKCTHKKYMVQKDPTSRYYGILPQNKYCAHHMVLKNMMCTLYHHLEDCTSTETSNGIDAYIWKIFVTYIFYNKEMEPRHKAYILDEKKGAYVTRIHGLLKKKYSKYEIFIALKKMMSMRLKYFPKAVMDDVQTSFCDDLQTKMILQLGSPCKLSTLLKT